VRSFTNSDLPDADSIVPSENNLINRNKKDKIKERRADWSDTGGKSK